MATYDLDGRETEGTPPEPTDVTVVVDYTGPDHNENYDIEWSPVWRKTTSGSWKGYKDGNQRYLGWPELVRRWGPVKS